MIKNFKGTYKQDKWKYVKPEIAHQMVSMTESVQ